MAENEIDIAVVAHVAKLLQEELPKLEQVYKRTHRHVRTVLRRQYSATVIQCADKPICQFQGLKSLAKALGRYTVERRLFTLARVYDEAHITLCKAHSLKRKGRHYNERLVQNPQVDLTQLSEQIVRPNSCFKVGQNEDIIDGRIVLQPSRTGTACLKAVWEKIVPISFENLPVLKDLSDSLPGETSASREYAGIGGGGGSDVISASLIGELLRLHKKEAQMPLLISTRTWATGSQGKNGKVGIKRVVHNHGGQATIKSKTTNADVEVAGTYKIRIDTYAEGRDLEAITVPKHDDVYMVLDQTESQSEIPNEDRADLKKQFQAVLGQREIGTVVVTGATAFGNKDETIEPRLRHNIDTVVSIDTGGDVFGAGSDGHVTPDQDYRVQEAISHLSYDNLVTAVVAPGVDAPNDAPLKALKAKGKVYTLTEKDQEVVLDLLKQYRMDGSDPSRFGKTTLALQARLRGVRGWTSIDLPEYVVDTWENPWTSFVYIRDCMNQIVFMPTKALLPIIKPKR